MRRRTAAVAAYGLLFATWAVLVEFDGGLPAPLYDAVHGPAAKAVLFWGAVLTGYLVGRPWVLLAIAGPVLALGLLQIAGHEGHHGGSPLTSKPTLVLLLWTTAALQVGVEVRKRLDRRRGESSGDFVDGREPLADADAEGGDAVATAAAAQLADERGGEAGA